MDIEDGRVKLLLFLFTHQARMKQACPQSNTMPEDVYGSESTALHTLNLGTTQM
jgi:hypothetical protein